MSRPHFAAILALTLFVGAFACSRSHVQPANSANEIASAIMVRVLTPPSPVLGIDDRIHLVYELQVVNSSSLVVSIDRVVVLDAAGVKLSELTGDALAKRIIIGGGESGKVFGASHSGYILMDVSLPEASSLPTVIRHRIAATRQVRAAPGDDHHGAPMPAGSPLDPTAVFVGAETPVGQSQAIAIAPPLRGPGWLIGNGCCAEINPHRGAVIAINGSLYVPERFAIDFVQLDRENRLFTGPADKLSSYAYFGVPVYAVADGTVVAVEDGAPEETPGVLPLGKKLATLPGNHVVMDIGNGHFALYAHLQLGSMRVKAGDRVRRGDVLGRLGNTGNTSNPHLHFHVMDRPSPLASNGLPFVFTNVASSGVVAGFEQLFEGKPAGADGSMAGPHPNRLPLDNHLVTLSNPESK
jgi:hypothetical protein